MDHSCRHVGPLESLWSVTVINKSRRGLYKMKRHVGAAPHVNRVLVLVLWEVSFQLRAWHNITCIPKIIADAVLVLHVHICGRFAS